MSENSRGLLFRKRNILGAALIAGIGLGIFLGKLGLFPGLGKPGVGGGNDGGSEVATNLKMGTDDVPSNNEPADADADADADNEEINGGEPIATQPAVVRVVIDGRRYLLREKKKEVPISLPDLINLIKGAPGDEEHFQVRIFRKMSARASAEEDLKRELLAAEIPDTAVLWVPPSAGMQDENSPAK